MHEVSFWVGVCLGRGDSGEVLVDIKVSDEEYDSLVECCRNEVEIADCLALADLRSRIVDAAIAEAASCDTESDIDYRTDAWYIVQMPDELRDMVGRQ